MAPGKWGLASESSWVCLRDAEHPPLELNLVIFTELVLSVFSLRFSWKISLYLAGVAELVQPGWTCHLWGKSLSFPMSGCLCGLPVTPLTEVKCSFDWNWWDFCLGFTWARSELCSGEQQSGGLWEWAVLRQLPAAGPSSSLAASLGSSGALLASPGDSEQLHPGAVCQWSSNPHQFGGWKGVSWDTSIRQQGSCSAQNSNAHNQIMKLQFLKLSNMC